MKTHLCIIALFIVVQGKAENDNLRQAAIDSRAKIQTMKIEMYLFERYIDKIISDLDKGPDLFRDKLLEAFINAYKNTIDVDSPVNLVSFADCIKENKKEVDQLANEIRQVCCVDIGEHSRIFSKHLSNIRKRFDVIEREMNQENIEGYINNCLNDNSTCIITKNKVEVEGYEKNLSQMQLIFDYDLEEANYNISHDDFYSDSMKDLYTLVITTLFNCYSNKN